MKTGIPSFYKKKCVTKKGIINVRTSLFIFAGVILLVFLILLISSIVNSNRKGEIEKMQESTRTENSSQSINEKVAKDIGETTDLIGLVRGIQVPNDGEVIFLTIEASIIDISKLGETDFTQETADIQMEKKRFNVAVDENTNLNVTDKDKINLGDFVIVKSPISIYEADKFTALQVEVQAKTQQ